jgi:hypothetical protein
MLSFHAKGYRAYIPGGPVKLVTGSKEHPVSLVSSVFFFVLFRSIWRFLCRRIDAGLAAVCAVEMST